MKKVFRFLPLLAGLLSTAAAYSQDVSMSVLAVPGSVPQGSTTGYVQVDICNNDPGSLVVPAYKLRPLVSGNSFITFTMVDLPAGWTVLSNNGTDVRVSNGTDNTMAPGDCRQILLHFTAVAQGSAGTITGTMAFSNGVAPGSASGPATAGDDPGNNNPTTSITVTGAPLPVAMTFSARAEGARSLLSWETFSEQNNQGFGIERSAEGSSWTRIGYVASQAEGGNSSSKLSYTAYDTKPLSGLNIYRLRQVDLDGQATYSENQEVRFDGNGSISIYPNPATDKVSLQVSDRSRWQEVRLLDLQGRLLYRSADLEQGVDMRSFPRALYLLQVTGTDGTISSFKINKQ